MRYLIALLRRSPVVVCGIMLLAACGGSQADSRAPTPTNPGAPVLNVFGPTGAKAAFDALQLVLKNSALPYEMRVFEGTSTGPGVQGVLDGKFDLMVMMRRPLPAEPLAYIEFFRTPIVFFVSPGAGIHNLTREQAAAVYSGEVTNWSELGGADQAIVVLIQEADDTSTEAVRDYIMQGKPFSDSARVLIDDLDVLTVANGMPGAIGYASWAGKMYHEFISSNEYETSVTLDGLPPDDPAYALVSAIGIAYRPEREAFLLPLFEWGGGLMASSPTDSLTQQFGLRKIDDELATGP